MCFKNASRRLDNHADRFCRNRAAWVQTKLQGERGMNPKAMPLNEYIAETMDILKTSPDADEVLVERSKPMRCAERGDYGAFFKR